MKLLLIVWVSCAAALAPARRSCVRPATARFARKAAGATQELARLGVGQRLSGRPVSAVFAGARGAKCFLDVGVVQTLGNGTAVAVPGLLRLPPWRAWRNGTERFAALAEGLRKGRVPAYVAAARPDSRRLVLAPFPPRPRPGLPLSRLAVGDELRGAKVVALTARAAWLDVPAFHDGARPGRRARRLRACLVGRRLPEGYALATQAVKRAGTKVVVRVGDAFDAVYARKPEPASGRLEVSLQPVDAAALAAESDRAAETRRRRAARAAATRKLAAGAVVRGAVVRRERYGAVVDFGASAFGLVPRGDRAVDFLAVGDAVRAVVAAVEPRDGFPHAPRVTLDLLDEEEDEDEDEDEEAAPPEADAPTDDGDRLEDVDDIEADLGMDFY